MRFLLISNSTMAGEPYLDYCKNDIADFLGKEKIQALFIPYAGITFSYDEYASKVKDRFNEVGHDILSIHDCADPVKAVESAEAIVVGGGNTWHLLHEVRRHGLIESIRKKVQSGTPYIGWSAGSNLSCPTIKTTNDMPIIDPKGFEALQIIPFQINPHYLDKNPEGHGGETREQRIEEFLEVNQNTTVLGLREGCMLVFENGKLQHKGKKTARLFQYKQPYKELGSQDDFDFLMHLTS